MVLRFFNSLGNKIEEFKPIKKGFVGLYTCGPTVYNYAHIGNLRAYTWEDLVKRYLVFKGFNVKHVMNITDVEDKIIRHSNEKKLSIYDYTAPFKKAFFEDLKALGIIPANEFPEATQYVPQMVKLIKKLLESGVAYKGEDGSVYFSIKKFSGYGKLAHIDTKKLKAGARVKQDEYEKEGVGDFALWKAWDESDGTAFWDTPLGKGRPGWHIECSAMSTSLLGDSFDIHMGGVDNKFPHHENEIAQTEGATGKKFVNYWLHCEHLLVNNEKMAKSKGNFFTLRDLLGMELNPRAIRFVLIYSHYRQQLNFTVNSVKDAQKTLAGLQNLIDRLREVKSGKDDGSAKVFADELVKNFEEAMDNDFGVPQALSAVFDFSKKMNKLIDENAAGVKGAELALAALKKIDSVLGVLDFSEKFFELSQEQEKLVKEREKARKEKNWKLSDELREELRLLGVEVIDNKDGSTAVKPLN